MSTSADAFAGRTLIELPPSDVRDGDRVVQQRAVAGREDAFDPRDFQRLPDPAQTLRRVQSDRAFPAS